MAKDQLYDCRTTPHQADISRLSNKQMLKAGDYVLQFRHRQGRLLGFWGLARSRTFCGVIRDGLFIYM